MEKLQNFMEEHLLPVADKLASNKYLSSISNGLLSVMPFMVVGCFAMIIWCPPLDYTEMEPGFWCSVMQGWNTLATVLDTPINFICTITLDCMGLYAVASIASHLAKAEGMTGFLPTGLAVASYLICAAFDSEGSFTTSYLGGAGLFTGIVMSIFAIELLKFLVSKNFGRIDIAGGNVPPAITESFISLFPSAVVIVAAACINWLILLVTGNTMPSLIAFICSPLIAIMNNPFGIALLAVIVDLFWWFGIHDSAITGALDPLLATMTLANSTAFASGVAATELPYIVTKPFYWIFLTVGGSGATLALAILLLCFSKSKHCKMIGKLGIVPALFNINEPIIFGLPIMMNPIMFIPFVLSMGVNALLTYGAMALKLCNTAYLYPSWNLPAPIGALLSTLDFKAVIVMLVIIAVDGLLYYPFFKIYDNQKAAEEAAA